MASVIDKLPQAQRQVVIDALLAGESLRKVAGKAGVSHTQVAEYKRKVFTPTLQAAQKINAVREIAQTVPEQVANTSSLTRAALAADPFLARVEALRADREKVKALAIEGEKPDLRAWASLDKNDLTELELHARLAGRLESAPKTEVNLTFCAVPGQVQGAQLAQVIDMGEDTYEECSPVPDDAIQGEWDR